MLRTDDLLLLSEALTPPPGFQADLLVGTTYSLHLSALLSVPLALTFADWEAEDGSPNPDPVAALEAVRRHAARITVFCQAGATAATDHPPLVASWLEDVVVPVKAPFGGVFHPKVWVVRYRDQESDAVRYRMLCGSRNLTFDRSWDTVLVLDGAPTPRGGRERATDPLADFVGALPGLATGRLTPDRAQQIAALSAELRRVRFTPPEPFHAVAFHPLGITGHRADPFEQARHTRMLVMAPFAGMERLQQFTCERKTSVLVSRGEELARLATAKLDGFARVCSLDDSASVPEAAEDHSLLSGLHAKLFVADAGHDAFVWTGSANATSAAFRKNVEFLVRLDGKRIRCGVDAILGDPADQSSLACRLEDCPRAELSSEPDARVRLERELDELGHHLAERRIAAVVTGKDPGQLEVELRVGAAPKIPPHVDVRCWPLTGRADRDARTVAGDSTTLARFGGQALAELTAFYIFAFEATHDDISLTKQVLVRADLEGVPEGRSTAILRELLRDPEQVMRLLRALLAFDAARFIGDTTGQTGDPDDSAGGGQRTETPLLESLLRALDEAPDKIAAIASLVEDLANVADLLPADFLEIWEPIHAVYAEDRR